MGDHSSDSFAICGHILLSLSAIKSPSTAEFAAGRCFRLSCDCSEIEDEHLHQCNCDMQVT
jgi:hypothetical protein